MHSILITGGAGFIGTHTVVALHSAGYRPVVIDNFANSSPRALDAVAEIIGERPAFYEGDCCDRDFVADVFAREAEAGTPITGIIHFAAHKAVGESVAEPFKYYRNNLGSLLTILEIMSIPEFQDKEARPLPLIFSSSATVYGDPQPDNLPLTETTRRQPATNPYGATKTIGEDILRDISLASGSMVRGIALRYFNPIGAHQSGLIGEDPVGTPANLVPYLVQAASGRRSELTVFGDDYPTPDGTGVRDYIHVVDLAEAHVAALTYALESMSDTYDVFNIGTGSGTSVKELIDTFEKVNGVRVPHVIGARRPGDIAACYADANKAADVLGWRARLDLETTLTDAWRWERNCLSKSKN